MSFLSPSLQDLIIKMLEFNPTNRWSFKECIELPLFDKVRNKNLEKIDDLEKIQ